MPLLGERGAPACVDTDAVTHGTGAAAARDGAVARLNDESFRLRALMDFVAAVAAATGSADIVRVMAAESRTALAASSASLSVWERDRGRMRTLVNHGDLGPDEVAEPDDEVYQLADHPLADRMFRKGIGYRQSVRDPGADVRVHRILVAETKDSCLARAGDVRGTDLGRAVGHPSRGLPALRRR